VPAAGLARGFCLAFLLCLATAWAAAGGDTISAAATNDWPMLAHDPARSGTSPAELRPPFQRKWYRLFPDEGLMAGVQPVIAEGRVFVGTMRGILHAIDAETGRDLWTFQAGGTILHTAAAAGGKVFFGAADGKVYAVHAADGHLAWSAATGGPVWNAPLVADGMLLVGSRDGSLYAFDSQRGALRWAAATGGPLLGSPALDPAKGHVYVGSEDMHVYALDARGGKQIWQSDKLPGASLRGYHPVIAPDGSVLVSVEPVLCGDTFAAVLLDMVREVFGDFASWRHSAAENARLRAVNFKLMENAETYRKQLDYLRRRLAEEPAYQTFFVLDPASGKQKFVAPIVYAESMNGPGSAALVTRQGRVIVKYQALLRSRYEHYSPLLNVGYLDTSTGQVTPVMDQSRTYGWHDSLLLVHDEQCRLSAAGHVLLNTHQDNVNAMDLDTLGGYAEPFCRNIHEPQPGEALGIWACLLRGQPVPVGKEWLARGTAVYGGGSAIGVPVAIAGDSFYYVPSHEINAGAAVIAYRMQPGGSAATPSPPPPGKLTDDEWRKGQQLPWDWDTLAMPRLDHVLAALPGKVPGTRMQPLAEEAARAVAEIPDGRIDRFIWEAPLRKGDGAAADALAGDLARAVGELIRQEWRPLQFPAAKAPAEAYRFFVEPTETLEALARAYPHLDPALQQQVQRYVARMAAPGGPLAIGTGLRTFAPDQGQNRAAYDLPPRRILPGSDDLVRSETARLYPLWLWAHASGDWSKIRRDWPQLRGLADQPPDKAEEDCGNGYTAGLIAFCRMASRLDDQLAAERGVAKARAMLRQRLQYELAYPRGGLIARVPVGRSIFARWRHLTPEIGRLLADYAPATHRRLMDVYVDYHRPTWWLAWNVEIMMRNEAPLDLPTTPAEIFAARALILGEPAEKLRGFLDLPWCKADLFFIEKLVCSIEAGEPATWRDVRQGK
jgi:hypothetical protein